MDRYQEERINVNVKLNTTNKSGLLWLSASMLVHFKLLTFQKWGDKVQTAVIYFNILHSHTNVLLFDRSPDRLSSITTVKVNWELRESKQTVYFGTSVSTILISAVVCCCCWSISKDCMSCICFC